VTAMLRHWLRFGPDRVTRRDADRLLDGGSAGAHPDLADLLAAAAGPPRPDELAGERAAVSAFRREFRPVSTSSARARRPRRRAGIVTALTAAVLAVGGTAYAATTGQLPDAVQRAVDGVFSGGGPSGSPDSTPPPGSVGTTPAPAGSAADPTVTVPGGPGPGVDEARLKGLCRSWEATRDNPHANAISAEDLRVLAAAAGGEDRIEAFCAALRSRPAEPPAPDKPGNPNPGGGRPTAPPGGGHTRSGPK
jgi:hypothetical protein